MTDEAANEFKYRVFYESKPPDHASPFGNAKTEGQIEAALHAIAGDIRHRLADPAADVRSSGLSNGAHETDLTIRTTADADTVRAAVVASLKSLGLFGDERRGLIDTAMHKSPE